MSEESTPRSYWPGYQALRDTPGSSAVSEMSLDDERPAGVPTFDMTALAMPRPDHQSDMLASGAAADTQEIQIDGRFAPYPVARDDMEVGEEGREREPETDMDVDDEPAKGSRPIVTPNLTAEQVLDMCTGAGREALTVVDRHRANLFRACPYLSPGALPEDASHLRIIAEEKVQFA